MVMSGFEAMSLHPLKRRSCWEQHNAIKAFVVSSMKSVWLACEQPAPTFPSKLVGKSFRVSQTFRTFQGSTYQDCLAPFLKQFQVSVVQATQPLVPLVDTPVL
jgi:hypothetical protein